MASGPACFEAADMAAEHSSRGFTQRWGWWGNESTATVFSEKLAIQFPRDDRSPLASLCLHVCTCLRIHDQFRARVLGVGKAPADVGHVQFRQASCMSTTLHNSSPPFTSYLRPCRLQFARKGQSIHGMFLVLLPCSIFESCWPTVSHSGFEYPWFSEASCEKRQTSNIWETICCSFTTPPPKKWRFPKMD